MTDVYGAAYTTIRAGAPGLSDATCEVIARTIARKVKASSPPTTTVVADQLAALIERRLLGVAPDDQDLVLEDHDWQRIIEALRKDSQPIEPPR